MIHIVYFLSLIDQAIIEVFLFHQLTHRTKSFLSDVALWFGLFAGTYIIFGFMDRNPVVETLQSLTLLPAQIIVLWRCTDSFRKKVMVLLINIVIPVLVELVTIVGVSIITDVPLRDFYGRYNDSIYVSVGRVMVNDWLFLTVIAVVLIYRHRDLRDRYFRREMGMLIGFMVIHLCFLIAYYRTNMGVLTEMNNLLQYGFQSMLFIMIFLQYFNAQRTRRLTQSEAELRALQSRMETDHSYYKLAESKFTEISALRHDIQNQMQTVCALLHSESGREQAENIIAQLQMHLDEVRAVNYCENPTVNAVLTVKLGEERMHGIRTEIVLQDCAALPFDDYDLCSLVSNLFDNAVNASQNCDETQERLIELKSGIRDGYYILRCTNPCREPKDAKRPERQEGHGYGLEIVEGICRKYDGAFTLRFADGTACATASLRVSGV